MNEIFTITIPLIIGIIGTISSIIITYILNKKSETEKEIREIKYKAYTDYINIDIEYANATKKKQTEMDNKYFGITGKLCLYANKEVLSKYAKYLKKCDKSKKEWEEPYTELITAMRKDIGKKILDKLSKDDIKKALDL